MLRMCLRTVLVACALLSIVLPAPPAQASSLSWNNAAGGSASTASNWTPNDVPDPDDDLIFNLANTYTVTYNGTVDTVRTHTYKKGSVTLSLSADHTSTDGFTVGDFSGDSATATLTTGTLISNVSLNVGDSSGSTGTLNVNDDDALLQTVGAGSDLFIGRGGTGTLNVTGGGKITIADDFIIGSLSSGVGTATISGFEFPPLHRSTVETTSDSGDVFVGLSGDGVLDVLNGGVVLSAGDLNVASVSGSTGAVTVDGSGAFDAAITVADDLLVSHNFNDTAAGDATMDIVDGGDVDVGDVMLIGDSHGGSGTLTVASGGSLDVDGPANIDDDSVMNVNDSTVNVLGDMDVHGLLSLSNGTYNGNIRLFNGALSGHGVVQGDVLTTSTANTITASGGTLELGDDAGVFDSGNGTLAIGSATVILHDANTSQIGDTTISTGTLTSDHHIHVEPGDALSGAGTINADIFNDGTMTPTGAGLTINGTLFNTTDDILGTKIHFGAGGGYEGAGTCTADITGAATALILPTADLIIGRNTTAGISYGGTIDVGDHFVTMLDSNGAVLNPGAFVNMVAGGKLKCVNGIGVSLGAEIVGEGTLDVGSDDVIISGVLDPQRDDTDGGDLDITGNLVMNPSGLFDMEISGTPQSQDFDRTDVSGTATFGGTIRVKLKNGFVPKVGQQFIAINATQGRTDTFDTVIPPAGDNTPCNGVTFVLVYSSTAAIVLVRPPLGCTALGDLDSDGGCDIDDAATIVDLLLDGAYDNCADMNGDCLLDGDDLQIMVNCLL